MHTQAFAWPGAWRGDVVRTDEEGIRGKRLHHGIQVEDATRHHRVADTCSAPDSFVHVAVFIAALGQSSAWLPILCAACEGLLIEADWPRSSPAPACVSASTTRPSANIYPCSKPSQLVFAVKKGALKSRDRKDTAATGFPSSKKRGLIAKQGLLKRQRRCFVGVLQRKGTPTPTGG